ncbi:hypothetical protein PGB90_008443 [Kerria lacca]
MKNNETCQWHDTTQKEIIKRRWNILAEALFANKFNHSRKRDLIKNNLNYFNLFSVYCVSEENNDDIVWYQYQLKINGITRGIKIRYSSRNFTIEELTGFNNTGNVRVWPSEEILAYFILKHEHFFIGKTILEVGGGMSCLAGILLAQSVDCRSIHITDGNTTAIENVRKIIKENSTLRCPLSCDVLVWQYHYEHSNTYDIILAADCLFFDNYQIDLIRLMAALLNSNGTILVMAPKRGDTLQKFVNLSREFNFTCAVYRYYDEIVWSQHLKLKVHPEYKEDIHYPLLLILHKGRNTDCRMIL